MNVRSRVELNQAERDEPKALLSGGKHSARKLKRAQILLAADTDASDEEIARNVGVGSSTVYRTKRRFVLGNLRRRSAKSRAAALIASFPARRKSCWWRTTCSSPPAGRAAGRWSCWPMRRSG